MSSNIVLPSQFLPGSQIGERGVAGLTQKLLFISPTFAVGWASMSMTKAQAAVRHLSKHLSSPELSRDQVGEALESLPSDLHDVQLVYLGVQALGANGANAFIGTFGGTETPGRVAAGSGLFHFDELLSVGPQGFERSDDPSFVPTPLEHDLAFLLNRFASVIFRETFDETPLNFGYGGLFEVVILGSSRRLVKLPYTLVYWLQDGDDLVLRGPITVVAYDNMGLMIATRTPLAEVDSGTAKRFVIEASVPELGSLNATEERPTIYCHLIRRSSNSMVVCHINSEREFSVSNGQLTIRNEFQAYLLNMLGAKRMKIATGARG